MKYCFTSDTHFSHSNIIKYCDRPFVNAAQMDEVLIKNWNEVVTPDDIVYHLGDVAFCKPNMIDKIMQQLQFKHLHVISGNHDRPFAEWYYNRKPSNVTFYPSYLETKINGQTFTLCHYALRVFNKSHRGAWHLYGHSHGTLPDDRASFSFDCGVDCHDYRPITFEEVQTIMSKKEFKGVDHHGAKT